MIPTTRISTVIVALIIAAISVDAFSPLHLASISRQLSPSRASTALADSDGEWFSSLTVDHPTYSEQSTPDLWTNFDDSNSFRKVMDPSDSSKVMNQIQIPDALQNAFADSEVAPSTLQQEVAGRRKVRAKVSETGRDSMRHYIKMMCNHELLNKNEEIILAREIQILLKWEESRDELENQLLR